MNSEPFRTPYPSYDVLDKWDSPSWNEATRKVVADRLGNLPPRRFLDEAEFALLRSLMDCILPQPERDERERIPVEALIDAALFDNRGRGTRYAGMPRQQDAWRRGLAGIAREAEQEFGRGFDALS
ncbi:MAG TPA: gluconate 2-dehydrogenase subunit 3 family protein, partial [Paracoccaceae bacterium]|nr:gluconate 2-dehydrogenase subunit 3 family protein [Paracoccaceae bacterium]